LRGHLCADGDFGDVQRWLPRDVAILDDEDAQPFGIDAAAPASSLISLAAATSTSGAPAHLRDRDEHDPVAFYRLAEHPCGREVVRDLRH
ncbi:MAG TPA: hypothetical protein VFN75_06910, partial [Pseudonocardiaceae bacterium]|nr:hypothetical protein [Pseudonocardiaceae bacterium]